MRTALTGIFAAILLCGCTIAQDATPAPTSPAPQAQAAQTAPSGSTQPSASLRIAPGSVIPVQLTKSIDAKKVKTGDEVEAKVTQDMKAGNGEVIVAKDTKVVGRVTEAQARNKEQKESQLGIAFDRAVMKSGGDVSLPMSIQAIIAPSYLNPTNSSAGDAAGQPQSAGGAPQGNPNPRGGNIGGAQASAPPPSTTGSTEDKSSNAPRQPITGNTQGVLGIPNLKLSTADTAQGSVLSSEKNNVKLESGTMMLLRVNGSANATASPQP
jgi:hypothetical protein